MATAPVDVRIDVSAALAPEITGGAPLHIAAWVFVPDCLPERPTVVTLLNGGTYDRRYFHSEVEGRDGYSCAEYLRARGHVVVLPDHLGVGASDRAKTQMKATRHVAAAANHAAVEEVHARLRAGRLVEGYPAIDRFARVGGGHSMGACQTITQQAAHRTYDLCVLLGYTADGVHLSFGGKLLRMDPGPLDMTRPDYGSRSRAQLRETFHWEDVPEDVIAVDDSMLVEVPYVLGTQAATTGIVREDATLIDTPVYLCFGERDVSPAPHAEPGYFTGSPDITLHILPRAGHCHNFASTRAVLFDRMDCWIRDQTSRLVNLPV